jgi:hypothetical protein
MGNRGLNARDDLLITVYICVYIKATVTGLTVHSIMKMIDSMIQYEFETWRQVEKRSLLWVTYCHLASFSENLRESQR